MTATWCIAATDKPKEITVAYFPEWPTANQVAHQALDCRIIHYTLTRAILTHRLGQKH